MATIGTLPLAADRWTPFVRILRFRGVDYTGATLAADVRQYFDEPGAAKIALGTASSSGAQGFTFLGVEMDGDVPVTSFGMVVSQATMAALPVPRPIGSDLCWVWDLLITPTGGAKRRRLRGPFTIVPGATQGGAAGTISFADVESYLIEFRGDIVEISFGEGAAILAAIAAGNAAAAAATAAETTRAMGVEAAKLDKSAAASGPEAIAGTSTTKWVAPAALKAAIDAAVTALINGAPGALDTLDELAAALGDDANFAATVVSALAAKATSAQLATAVEALQTVDSFLAAAISNSDIARAAADTALGGRLDVVEDAIAPTTVTPDGVEQYAVVIEDRAAGLVAPLMRKDARLVGLSAKGGVELVATASDLAAVVAPMSPDGEEEFALVAGDPSTGWLVPILKRDGSSVARNADGGFEPVVTRSEVARLDPDASYTATTWSVGDAGRWLNAWADADTAWIVHVHMGQSPAEGFNTSGSDHPVSVSPLYPANSWMLDDSASPAINGKGPRRRGAPRTTALVPLVERESYGYKETACSGFANHLLRDIYDGTGDMLNIVSIVAAFASRPYEGLRRGQPVYNDMLASVADAVSAIRARGGRRIVTVLSYDGGESEVDAGDSLARSIGQLRQFARQARADIAAITGEREAFPAFAFQPSHLPAGATVAWDSGARFGCSVADEDGLMLVGPRYALPMADFIHVTSAGQYLKGQMLARAVREEWFGVGWLAVRPVAWWWTGAATLTVRFSLPAGSLVLDTSNTSVNTTGLTSHGFAFDDGSGSPPAIAGVAVSGSDVSITLAAAPTGRRPRLGYAITRNTGNTTDDGPATGARGTLRADAAHVTIAGGGNQYDWAAAFVLNLY